MVRGILTQPYRALILDEEEEYEEVIVATSEALRDNPEHGVALNNRGVAFAELGRADEALDDLRRAAAALMTSGVPYVNSGDVLRQLGRVEEALRHYSAAIEREPDNACYRRSRGHLLHRLGQRLQAISDYDVAIRLDPEFRRTREDRQRAQAGLPPVA
jgi:tetratricopeptide (TPR) repeat protein